MCFVSSRNNIADALSCLTKIPESQGEIQDKKYVREVTLQAVPEALRIEEIEEASAQDLKVVHACLQSGDWSKVPKDFAVILNELTYLGQVVLRGTRIVIPEKLRKRVLDLSHERNQGTVKTKERIRSKVW